MKRAGLVLLFVLLPGAITGCVSGERSVLHRRLNVSWSPGQTWGVKVRVWSERYRDEQARDVSPEALTWRYRVARVHPETGRYTVVQSNGDVAGRLLFSSDYNLLEVGVFRGRRREGALQVQSLLTNSLGGRAMIQRRPAPDMPVLWFHPDMAVRHLDGSTRMNFDPGPGDWVTQTVRPGDEGDRVKIVLSHPPSRTTATFRWRRGEPWWDRLVWERRRRVVALAERVPPPDLSDRSVEVPPLRSP